MNEPKLQIDSVMGPTGAGKSTVSQIYLVYQSLMAQPRQFVKAATGVDDVGIGHGLVSCTDKVRAVRCHHPSEDCDIVLVDTPGFDDTFKSDAKILEHIANWLKETFE
jgi:predicted GTPase